MRTSSRPSKEPRLLALATPRGPVECRYYAVADATASAVFVGGVGGGWDTPARGLYPGLADELRADGIASLRVRFRNPVDFDEAVFDVRSGLAFLAREGVDRVALVGHSFGGAVVVRAAARTESVRTVVTLSTQSYGADAVRDLAPGASVLLVHGTEDDVLPAQSSQYVHAMAREPKRLVLYEGARHGLDEVAHAVRRLVRDWIVVELRREPSPG